MSPLLLDPRLLARCRTALAHCAAVGEEPAVLVGCLAIGCFQQAAPLEETREARIEPRQPQCNAGTAWSAPGANTAPIVSLLAAQAAYLDHLARAQYTLATRTVRATHLRLFCAWAATQGMTALSVVTADTLRHYQDHLLHHRTRSGTSLSLASQHTRLAHLRAWWAWLTRTYNLAGNPAADLTLPRLGAPLPPVLNMADAERVLTQPELTTAVGVRDRAILETLYATGVRRTELLQLTLPMLDRSRGLITIRQGKGRRDRVVPLGTRALGWLERYLAAVRPHWVREPDPGTVFLTARGAPIHPNHLSALVAGYVAAGGVGVRGACHLFRHTMATLMLEGGADIRFIQQMLGHAKLTTTQLYTHVSIRQLQAVHAATHPAVQMTAPGLAAAIAQVTAHARMIAADADAC